MIRPAIVSDAERILALAKQELGYEPELQQVIDRLASLDLDRECVLIAEEDGRAAGFVHVSAYESLLLPKCANLMGLAVDATYQGSGLGSQLLSAAEAWAVSHGMASMRVNSGESREEAHRFYRSMGYTPVKKQVKFVKTLDATGAGSVSK
ncbi:MAG: GNAT family N-acetyltransferase [Lachnospiraceae bacterium]|nr:GNAT family N-acetyltransferase [Lachnospiraceae bacterium]